MSEMYPALEAYVSALSGGPVGPSDQIGTANVSLIMATWYVFNSYTKIIQPLDLRAVLNIGPRA